MPEINVIIPAYNEADSIAHVIKEIPAVVSEIIVVNNNSTDKTAENAAHAGATVLTENRRGYGYACLAGINYIKQKSKQPDIIVFIDGDYSDYPEELSKLIAPIITRDMDMVIGARVDSLREEGAMTPQQIFGNWLATSLMKLFFGANFTDLGPFRAIKYDTLMALNMEDKTYGWTVEMQLKVVKVSGTIKGSIFAGVKILSWIFKYSIK